KGPQENKSAVTPKKKSFISTNDNIIPEPDVAFKLGTSMSLNEAEEDEAARRVHATHEQQLVADTMQALKASRKINRSQSHTGGSTEGASVTLKVLNESTCIFTTSSEGTGIKPGVPDEEKKQVDQDDDDDRSIDIEETDNDKKIDDEFVHEATKGDHEQAGKLPPTSSSLSVSSGFGYKFLNLFIDISLIDEDDMDKAATAMGESTILKRNHDDQDEDPTGGSNQGKDKKRPRKDTQSLMKLSTSKESSKGNTPLKSSKSSMSVTTKEPNEEHVRDILLNAKENIIDEMGNADEQPDGEAEPNTKNALKNDWFKQPPRPPTPDPEWNKCQVIDDQPEQTWFNDLVSTQKDPLTLATPIDFSKFAKNRLKLDKITKADLVLSVYNLLKGTCQTSIDLEYNMEECYKALTDKLDWENPKGDRCLFDLSKPLPLKGRLGHLTIASEYFFNNDMEYLKSKDLERKYTTSITKAKATRYELVGIEDMILKQWSVTKILSVESVKVDKLHGYGYLEEIVVRRAGRQLYKFKEVIVDLAVALRMFTRSLIIKKRVEDVQLELYTPSFDPLGVAYEDLSYLKRLMRADELYKFSDETLKKVRDTLHHRLLNFQFGHNKDMPSRKWLATDKKKVGIMVDLIDKLMLVRRITRNLERLVGARELDMDYKLMQRTVFPKVAATGPSRVRFIATCSYSTNICKDIMKAQLKNFKKDGYTSFQDEERYGYVRLKASQAKGTSSSLQSKDHYTVHKIKTKIQDYEQEG
ncbi:hypothetical protein Tco_1130196, partial [Tanacetum coccineum]